jgi:hypothetical protein
MADLAFKQANCDVASPEPRIISFAVMIEAIELTAQPDPI